MHKDLKRIKTLLQSQCHMKNINFWLILNLNLFLFLITGDGMGAYMKYTVVSKVSVFHDMSI